jgi:RNA recognition motif-containing protein
MPSFLPGLIISLIIGIGGFLVLTFLPNEITPAVSFLISSLISGLAVSIFNNKGSDTEVETEESDSGEFATLYVGNLPYRVNEQAVKAHFTKSTNVKSVRLLRDRKTGKRKGFGFIEIPEQDTDKVIKKFNDSEFEDRTLKVRIAKDRVRDE